MRADYAAEMIDAAFEELGEPATYAPPAGVAGGVIMVMPFAPDVTTEFGDGSAPILQRSITIEVRASEVAAPVVSGTFIPGSLATGVFLPGSTVYRVNSEPQAKDERRLVWVCRCERV